MNVPMRRATFPAAPPSPPAVVLVKRPDAVQPLLRGADAYFAREVHVSTRDAHRLHKAVDWSPEDGVLTFYVGRAGSAAVGALEFVRVDTPHGPIEVAVGFTPQGTVRGVLVTKATVEMKPWVLEAVGAGLTNHYRQLKPGDAPNGAAAIAGQAGDLAEYIAGEVDKGVARALAAYGAFYRGERLGLRNTKPPGVPAGRYLLGSRQPLESRIVQLVPGDREVAVAAGANDPLRVSPELHALAAARAHGVASAPAGGVTNGIVGARHDRPAARGLLDHLQERAGHSERLPFHFHHSLERAQL